MSDIKRKLGMLEIKQALLDQRFRDMFPEYLDEINKFMRKPGCACNRPLYEKIFEHKDRLEKYFPGRILESPKEEAALLAHNNWTVINCQIGELESRLRKLPPGRKEIAISRYEDKVTVIVNDLGIVY